MENSVKTPKDRNPYKTAWVREARKKWKAEGRCADCGNPNLHTRTYCEKCAARHNRKGKELKERRRNAGLCYKCSRPIPDGMSCPICNDPKPFNPWNK